MTDTPADPTPTTDEDADTPADDDQTTAEIHTPASEDAPDTEDTERPPTGRNREEAYRKRARAAEVELILAQSRVSELNRAEAQRLCAQRLQDGTDLWDSGVDLDDLLNPNGLVDHEKVNQAVGELLARKPHLGKRGPATPPARNVTGDGQPPGEAAPKFVDAFKKGQG